MCDAEDDRQVDYQSDQMASERRRGKQGRGESSMAGWDTNIRERGDTQSIGASGCRWESASSCTGYQQENDGDDGGDDGNDDGY